MIGTTVGPYRIDRELGSGGMGAVYLATVEGDAPGADRGTRVAVKVIHPHLLATPGFFKRFLREAEIGRSVRHENVVRTLDVDATLADGKQVNYIVMEYVEGRTLRALLREMRTVPEALLRELAGQIAAGLAAIHEKGIVHRDLKPENVLVTKDHQVRIMDLGVARLQEATVAITKEGQFAGSLLYAAPEQFRREEVGPATDLYSLGVLLYELATGGNPFERDSAAQVIAAHLGETPRRARELNAEVSAFFSELTAALLAKSAAERVGSATELREVLRTGESSAWWAVREKSVRERERRLPPIQVRRETQLHGRETELALLAEAWSRAEQGRGNVVLLEGEAGIGKTRLVDAFLRTLPPEAHVLYGAYSPTGGLGGLSDAITEKFGRANLADSLRPYLAVTPSLVPSFSALLLHEAPPTGSEPLRGEAVHAVFCHLLRALGAERPTVWVIDELHYAPEESRTLVLAMARAVEQCRALLVVAARPGIPEEETGRLVRLEYVRRATVGRLSPRQVVQLLREAFKSEALAEKLGGKIGYKSDGVPYFVFEMIRGLREGQFVRQLPDGTFVETQAVSDIEVPSAVRDLIEGRLRDLSDEDRGLLDVAAVMGFEFDPDLVARVRERKRVQVLEALAKIERRSGVVRAAGRGYRFDHHQIQEVLAKQLSPVLAEEYHAMLAEAFVEREKLTGKAPADIPGEAAVFLATHALGGSRPEDALPYVARAVTHLAAAHRSAAEIELIDRALATGELLAAPERVRLLLRKAESLSALGHAEPAATTHEEAVALADRAGDVALRGRTRRELGQFLGQHVARFDDARRIIVEAAALAAQAGDAVEAAACELALGGVELHSGRVAEAEQHVTHGLAAVRAAGDRLKEAAALSTLASLANQSARHAEAEAHARAAAAIFAEVGDRDGAARAANTLAITDWYLGRFESAMAGYQRSLDHNRARGERQGEAIALVNIGPLHVVFGDARRGREALEESRAIARSIGARRPQVHALDNLGLAALVAGEPAQAEAYYRQAVDLGRELGYAYGLTGALTSFGSLLRRVGRAEEAIARFDEAAALARERGFGHLVVHASCLASALRPEGAAAARAALRAAASALDPYARMEASFALWQADGARDDLAAAWRELQFLRDHAPQEVRVSMMEAVPLHREIAAAAKDAGL